MNKYNLIFKLSFISYILVLIASPYITAATWADCMLFLFVFSCIYEFVYIIFLRKKENTSFAKNLAMYFLYVTFVGDVIVAQSFISALLNSFNSWEGVSFLFIGLPILVICTIYQIIYYRVKRKK